MTNSSSFFVLTFFLGGQAFLGTRPIVNGVPQNYEWQSYVEVQERVKHFGAGLAHLGLAPKSHFGVFSINRAEWVTPESLFRGGEPFLS